MVENEKQTQEAAVAGDVFVVDIKFRQNATWQGTILQKETGKSLSFRSELELMKIIDAALTAKYPGENEPFNAD